MCYKVDCRKCGKATWEGCGFHVRCALHGVEEKDRCPNWKNGAAAGCKTDNDPVDSITSGNEETKASSGCQQS